MIQSNTPAPLNESAKQGLLASLRSKAHSFLGMGSRGQGTPQKRVRKTSTNHAHVLQMTEAKRARKAKARRKMAAQSRRVNRK